MTSLLSPLQIWFTWKNLSWRTFFWFCFSHSRDSLQPLAPQLRKHGGFCGERLLRWKGLSLLCQACSDCPFPLVLLPGACWEPHLSFCVFQSVFKGKFLDFPESLRPLLKDYYSVLDTIPATAEKRSSFQREGDIQCIFRVGLMIARFFFFFFKLFPFLQFQLSGALFDPLYLRVFFLLHFIDLSAFKTVCLLLASNSLVWTKYLSSQIHHLVFNFSWLSNILW